MRRTALRWLHTTTLAGQLLLQPMVDTTRTQLDGPGAVQDAKPQLVVTVQGPTPPAAAR